MVGKMPFCKRWSFGFWKTTFYIAICHLLQPKRIPFTMPFVTYCMSVCYLFVRERCAHGCLCPALGLCVCAVWSACSMQMLSCVEACRDVAGCGSIGPMRCLWPARALSYYMGTCWRAVTYPSGFSRLALMWVFGAVCHYCYLFSTNLFQNPDNQKIKYLIFWIIFKLHYLCKNNHHLRKAMLSALPWGINQKIVLKKQWFLYYEKV